MVQLQSHIIDAHVAALWPSIRSRPRCGVQTDACAVTPRDTESRNKRMSFSPRAIGHIHVPDRAHERTLSWFPCRGSKRTCMAQQTIARGVC